MIEDRPAPGPDRERWLAARAAVAEVEDGMVVGLGTGSAASFAVRMLGARVHSGLCIRGIPTSSATRRLADAEGIPLVDLSDVDGLDLTIDGADEIAPDLSLTKGGGGALLFEKIVASASRRVLIIAEAKKRVRHLGAFATPVEIVPMARPLVVRALEGLGAQVRRREGFVSDGGHLIVDAAFGEIDDPRALAARLDTIVGVVEHGLFVGLASRAFVGVGDDLETIDPTC